MIGSAQKALTIIGLKKIKIKLPPSSDQTAITEVLSSLDDKIDHLHRENQTLEKMAETVFREWFVEGAQKSWKAVQLGNYVSCINGISYKSSELNSSKIALVTLKNFDRNGGFRLDGFKEFTGKYKEQQVVNQGDLVVAHTDITQDAEIIGNPIFVVADPEYDVMVISMDLVKVTSNYNWLSNEFLYLMMKSGEFKQHCLVYSNGSTVLHLNKLAIPEFVFLLPQIDLLNQFTLHVRPLLIKKFRNINSIRTITVLRDTLISKLMSGEVRVKI